MKTHKNDGELTVRKSNDQKFLYPLPKIYQSEKFLEGKIRTSSYFQKIKKFQ